MLESKTGNHKTAKKLESHLTGRQAFAPRSKHNPANYTLCKPVRRSHRKLQIVAAVVVVEVVAVLVLIVVVIVVALQFLC